MDAEPQGFCCAVSQPGATVTAGVSGTAALVIDRRGYGFICTQDPGHQGDHAACDGQGAILAHWPREAAERYWQPGQDNQGGGA
jgi:hypothetical protein